MVLGPRLTGQPCCHLLGTFPFQQERDPGAQSGKGDLAGPEGMERPCWVLRGRGDLAGSEGMRGPSWALRGQGRFGGTLRGWGDPARP